MTGRVIGLSRAKPSPASKFIDPHKLRFRPIVSSQFAMFLPSMVQVGRALMGADWRDAENVLDLGGRPLDPDLGGNLDRAYRFLVQAIVDQRLSANVWRDGLSTPPMRLNLSWLADDPITLKRWGYIWRDKRAYFVLVDAAGVSAIVQSLPSGTAHLPQDLDLSGDLRLMLQVVQECGIGPNERAKWPKDSIALEVKRIADRDGVSITPRRATEMARLIKGER